MGNVSSRPGDEANPLYLRDQARFSVAALTITNSRNRTLLTISPNEFPAKRYAARRDIGDDSPIEYIQDPDSGTNVQPPSFLLRLSNDDDLIFNFTFVLRRVAASQSTANTETPTSQATADSAINGLTFLFAPNLRDLDNLVTRELHADPNLHKNNPKVHLIGDYATGGSPSVQFQWSWRWKPPRPTEDRGGGWRNCCSFVEYDQRNHRLDPLATFTFWVQNTQKLLSSPKSPSPRLEIAGPTKLRVPSAQSIESRVSDSDGIVEYRDIPPQSPTIEPIPEDALGLVPTLTGSTAAAVKVDVACQRPGEDVSQVEDGPLFRATMKAMEQRTGSMRARWKKVLRRAEAALEAQAACNDSMAGLMDALRDASSSNANAVQPAIEHYFDRIAKEILAYEKQNTANLQKMIIEPIAKLYNVDIKQAENKKRDFEEESKEYYAYVSRYLGQRQDSLKEKKRVETDSKYQKKRRDFELRRFDYSSFMQDLHGGRKDQEVLSNLTRYADAQAKGYLTTASKIEALLPQLEALNSEVKEADKEFQIHRTEREEKRRALEKSNAYSEPERSISQAQPSTPAQSNGIRSASDLTRSGSTGLRNTVSGVGTATSGGPNSTPAVTSTPSSAAVTSKASILSSSPSQSNKFKGIRDLEEKDYSTMILDGGSQRGKEGLVWALSRPGSHADPKGLNKQAWHKFWIVLDQGKLSEYTGWKEKLDLHMEPIDLRVASVREARNADRRFCFEIITPHFTRVYQAQSEEDMRIWINAINNALQSTIEGKGLGEAQPRGSSGSINRDIASVLTGKSASTSHRSGYGGNKTVGRHATVGDRPSTYKPIEVSESSQKLLQQIRDADAGNKYCADCGSENKVDWVSINLGIIICIECSGIHRSLGTHISKVRSLTLDPNAFTIDVIEILLTVGNRVSNMIWEARLDQTLKPAPQASREQRLRFITAKYVERVYVLPISSTLSHYPTADETLLASIKKNDVHNVIYALALRANANVHDRSRNTHAVFLALAAADPASPSAATSPGASPNPPRTSAGAPPRKPFHVAELLILNGAEPPNPATSPIPLSPAARMYLDAKEEQKSGRKPVAPSPFEDVGVGSGGDTLTALPVIQAGNGTSPGDRAREREERLRKRVSAGGRLVKQSGSGGGY